MNKKIQILLILLLIILALSMIIIPKFKKPQIKEDVAKQIFIENRDKIESDISLVSNITIEFVIPEKLEHSRDGSWWFTLRTTPISQCQFHVGIDKDKIISIYYDYSCKDFSKETYGCRYFSCKPIVIFSKHYIQ